MALFNGHCMEWKIFCPPLLKVKIVITWSISPDENNYIGRVNTCIPLITVDMVNTQSFLKTSFSVRK